MAPAERGSVPVRRAQFLRQTAGRPAVRRAGCRGPALHRADAVRVGSPRHCRDRHPQNRLRGRSVHERQGQSGGARSCRKWRICTCFLPAATSRTASARRATWPRGRAKESSRCGRFIMANRSPIESAADAVRKRARLPVPGMSSISKALSLKTWPRERSWRGPRGPWSLAPGRWETGRFWRARIHPRQFAPSTRSRIATSGCRLRTISSGRARGRLLRETEAGFFALHDVRVPVAAGEAREVHSRAASLRFHHASA